MNDAYHVHARIDAALRDIESELADAPIPFRKAARVVAFLETARTEAWKLKGLADGSLIQPVPLPLAPSPYPTWPVPATGDPLPYNVQVTCEGK